MNWQTQQLTKLKNILDKGVVMNKFDEVSTRVKIRGRDVTISHLFNYIEVDGRRLKLKQNTEWAYKVQKTQVQCVSAERLFEFLTREDEFWHSTVDKILKDIAERQ